MVTVTDPAVDVANPTGPEKAVPPAEVEFADEVTTPEASAYRSRSRSANPRPDSDTVAVPLITAEGLRACWLLTGDSRLVGIGPSARAVDVEFTPVAAGTAAGVTAEPAAGPTIPIVVGVVVPLRPTGGEVAGACETGRLVSPAALIVVEPLVRGESTTVVGEGIWVAPIVVGSGDGWTTVAASGAGVWVAPTVDCPGVGWTTVAASGTGVWVAPTVDCPGVGWMAAGWPLTGASGLVGVGPADRAVDVEMTAADAGTAVGVTGEPVVGPISPVATRVGFVLRLTAEAGGACEAGRLVCTPALAVAEPLIRDESATVVSEGIWVAPTVVSPGVGWTDGPAAAISGLAARFVGL